MLMVVAWQWMKEYTQGHSFFHRRIKGFKILEDLVSIPTAPQVDNGFVLTTPL